jgi:3-dehydroquinate synthase
MKKLSGRIITIERTPVFLGQDVLSSVDRFIRQMHLGREGIFILADKNTRKHCLSLLMENSGVMADAVILEIEGGEGAKTLATAERLWNEMLEAGAGRNSLLVNLGGGVVSDLGGFVAAGYKRGISYINIPTSLVGQCDAAIGGKTSVNTGILKNQVGFFYSPKAVFICPRFLATLPAAHFRSGMAEIIKCALVGDAGLWRRILHHPVPGLLSLPPGHRFLEELLTSTVNFKNRIVNRDYREQKLRKVLNFGHTIGHALESRSLLDPGAPLLHGDAVAAGMICALFLSTQKTGLDPSVNETARKYLVDGFPPCKADLDSIDRIMEIMAHDKKNFRGKFLFTLLSAPGYPLTNISCDRDEVAAAIQYYIGIVEG